MNAERRVKARHFASLDGFRAISVFLVVLAHSESHAVRRVTDHLVKWDIGNLGVRTFFVISGFLITSLLLTEKDTTGAISLRRFYFRRMLRILPAYSVFLLVVALLIFFGFVAGGYRDLLPPLLYVSNYWPTSESLSHTWSLSVEEQFYLIWPCALVFFGIRRGSYGAMAILLIAPVIRILDHTFAWDNPRYAFETVADSLGTGCMLALFRPYLWSLNLYRRSLQSRWFFMLAVLLLIGIGVRHHQLVWDALGISLVNVGIAVCLDRYMRLYSGPLGQFLNWRPIAWVGALSYSIYLWQQVFLLSARYRLPFPLDIVGILLVSAASYYLVERPFLKLKDSYSIPAGVRG